MPSLELGDICFEEAHEIERRRKVRMAEIVSDDGAIAESESPFSSRNLAQSADVRVKLSKRERFDIQNIGSGTRCTKCSLLHFCWTPRCAGCNANMEYNLGR
jgi:hypothetical protein